MRAKPLWLLLVAPLAAYAAVAADCSVEIRDGGVADPLTAPCLVRDSGGYVVISRSALAGAVSAELLIGERRLSVRFVVADNPYADLVEVWTPVGTTPLVPAPISDLPPPEAAVYTTSSGEKLALRKTLDEPGLGQVLVLEGGAQKHAHGTALFDATGAATALLACHMVNGSEVHYAIPAVAIREMQAGPLLTLAEWNARNKLDRASAEGLQNAIGYFWYGEIDGARFYLEKYVEANPEDPRGWFLLGFAEGKSGNSRRKILAYRRAVELDPAWSEAHYNLGIALAMAGEMAEAKKVHARLLELDETLANRLAQFLDEVHVDKLPEKTVKPPKPGKA
jgi:hypothetical protein